MSILFYFSLFYFFNANLIQESRREISELTTFQAKKKDIIFHIIDQGKVSRVPLSTGLALDARMVTWNYTWTVPLKGFKRNFERCMSRSQQCPAIQALSDQVNMNGFVFKSDLRSEHLLLQKYNEEIIRLRHSSS